MLDIICNRQPYEVRTTTWSGGKDRVQYLTDEEIEIVMDTLEDMYPDGISETHLNDIFWFEEDWVAELIGFKNFEEIRKRGIIYPCMK